MSVLNLNKVLLQNSDDTEAFYPQTSTDIVFNENGENLDTLLSGKLSKEVPVGDGIIFNTSGTTKSRFFTLKQVPDWVGWTLNASFTNNGWVLDNPSLNGWFFKLDSRNIMPEFAVYRILPGEGAHTDEYAVFVVKADGTVKGVDDKTLSSNDFTDEYKTKLDGVANTGQLSQLTTTDKTSIVSAINELKADLGNSKTTAQQVLNELA